MPSARPGLLLVCFLLASCAGECGRISRKVQAFFEMLEVLAWICAGVFILVFLGGGIVTLVKNLRTPSVRSKGWGRALGAANLLFGVLFLANAITHPPHEVVTERVDRIEEVSRVDAQGRHYIDTEIVGSDEAAEGGINWVQLMQLLVFGIGWSGFGFAGVWASRKARV